MRPRFLLPGLAAAALVAAGCGSNDTTPTSTPARPAKANIPGATITSALALDRAKLTVTLPLYKGTTGAGKPTWYIITDSSRETDAARRGVNFAPKLANAVGTKAAQRVTGAAGALHFPGTVDFSPKRSVTPDPAVGFPPKAFKPGAVGDKRYSPIVELPNGTVLNAPQVANASGRHDSVVAIDFGKRTVTLGLLSGFVNGRPSVYLRTDGSIPLLAAIEASTYAPNLNAAPGLGSDDPKTSARSAIIPVVNGPRKPAGENRRQGLQSALRGEGPPQNIQQSPPGAPDYSPLWDVHPVVWSAAAITSGKRRQLRSAAEVVAALKRGLAMSGGTGPADSSLGGLRTAKFVSNCTTVQIS